MRPRHGECKIAGMQLALELELHRGSPIVGVIREDGADERPFHGWLDLLGALEDAASRVNSDDQGEHDEPQHP